MQNATAGKTLIPKQSPEPFGNIPKQKNAETIKPFPNLKERPPNQ
jgi:hypothetical protein